MTTEKMLLQVNAEPCEVDVGTTLAELLMTYHIDPEQTRGVAVAVNEEVVRKKDWVERLLATGDQVEIITARQGG